MNSQPVHQGVSAEGSFSARDYFLGIAQDIVTSLKNVHVALPDKGEIYLFPRRNEYHANVADMAEFCLAPASQFKVTVLNGAPQVLHHGPGLDISGLLWQAAFHASQGLMIEGSSKFDVVQFRRWPNLTRLPKTPNTMRICALLTRYPMTIMLVHRKLGIEKKELYQTISAAYCAGIANVISHSPQEAANESVEDIALNVPEQKRNLLQSLFSKITGL